MSTIGARAYRVQTAMAFLRRVQKWTGELRMACEIVGMRFELRVSDDRTGGTFVADMAGSRVEYETIKINLERDEST